MPLWRSTLHLLVFSLGCSSATVWAAEEPITENPTAVETVDAPIAETDNNNEVLRLRIADPYIDVHTGPSEGHPIHQVVERGQMIDILERRTDWFLVRTPRDYTGWVHRNQLIRTLTPQGQPVDISQTNLQDFTEYDWELGVMSGDFDGAPVISIYGAWQFADNISAELTLGQSLGRFAETNFATAHIVHHPFPQWRFSPYFQLGAGAIQIDPKGTIITPEDRQENLVHVGVGVRTYLASRLVFRMEYNNYVVLTDRNDNEKVEEWKAGFSVFF